MSSVSKSRSGVVPSVMGFSKAGYVFIWRRSIESLKNLGVTELYCLWVIRGDLYLEVGVYVFAVAL